MEKCKDCELEFEKLDCGEYCDEVCMARGVREIEMKAFKKIMKDHGMKIEIGGCGCCDSPWVRFKYEGKEYGGDNWSINMFSNLPG